MSADTKQCPECGNEVKDAAVICRFCRHDFRQEPPRQREVRGDVQWARFRGPGLLALGILAVVLLSLGAIAVADARSDLQQAEDELLELDGETLSLRSSIEDTTDEVADAEQELSELQKANLKLAKRAEKIDSMPDEPPDSQPVVAADAQQAVEILRTAWVEDDRDVALAVADEAVVTELFEVPLAERDDYGFSNPECEEKSDQTAVCTFQYYACCPALIIFEWRGSQGYKAASISNPAD